MSGDAHPEKKALIVEDTRQADEVLTECGYACSRVTHNEVLSSRGTELTNKLLNGEYSLLWVSTPQDHSVRIHTTKKTPHWQRIQQWIQKACILGAMVIVFGQPGFLWNLSAIQEAFQQCKLTTVKIRLCHFGDKYDETNPKPSGTYLQVATTGKLSTRQWQCPCQIPIQEHQLDWYGRDQEHADWRKKISLKLTQEVCSALELGAVRPPRCMSSKMSCLLPFRFREFRFPILPIP